MWLQQTDCETVGSAYDVPSFAGPPLAAGAGARCRAVRPDDQARNEDAARSQRRAEYRDARAGDKACRSATTVGALPQTQPVLGAVSLGLRRRREA